MMARPRAFFNFINIWNLKVIFMYEFHKVLGQVSQCGFLVLALQGLNRQGVWDSHVLL